MFCLYSILLQYIVTFSKCEVPIQLPENEIQQYPPHPSHIRHQSEYNDCELPREMAEIPSHFFEDCVNYWLAHSLSVWWLDEKNISKIAEDAFDKWTFLTHLHLSNNKIVNLHKNTFEPLKELTYLNLGHNLIEVIDSDLFYYNSKIDYINLENNNIKIIGGGAFRMNPLLSTVSILKNPRLKRIDLTDFLRENGMHWEYLIIDLRNCGLEEIFIPMNVDIINVNDNQITSINAHPKNKLRILSLQNNNLTSIAHLELPFLENLFIKGNFLELSDVYGFKKLINLHIGLDQMQNISVVEIRKNLPSLRNFFLPAMKTKQEKQIRNDCKQYNIDCWVKGEYSLRKMIVE